MDIREMIRKCESLHFPLMWICSAEVSWFLFYAVLKVLTSKGVGLGLSFVVTLFSIGIILAIAYGSKLSPRIKFIAPMHAFISTTLILRILRQLNDNGRLPLWEEWIIAFVFLSALLALCLSPIKEQRRFEGLLSLSMVVCLSTRILMIFVDPRSSLEIEDLIFLVLFVTYSALNFSEGSAYDVEIKFPLTTSTFIGMSLGIFVFTGMKLSWLRISGASWGIHEVVVDTSIDAFTIILPWLMYIEYNRGERNREGSWVD